MATFQEVMRAAERAEAAGDADAARALVQLAQKSMGDGRMQYDDRTGAPVAQLPPHADAPGAVENPRQDRFGDTIRAATEGPIEATKAFARGVMDIEQSPTRKAAPDFIPDKVAQAGDAAMAGLSALGTSYAFGAGLAGEMLGGSPTGEMQLARDLMMAGQVAVPELAGVSSTARVAGRAGSASMKPPTAMQESARAAGDIGVTPSLGMGGKARGMAAATLEKVPGSGGLIAKDAERAVEEIERAASRITGSIGTASGSYASGEKLQKGLDGFVQSFRKKAAERFSEVQQAIPDGTVIQAPETVKKIKDAIEPFKNNPEIAKQLGLTRWEAIATDLEKGMTWRAASDLRSSIGESIGRINGALADMDQGKLKSAYASLTKDLEAAAVAAGPKAEQAWRRANAFYRSGAKRIERSLDSTISAKSPERAFEAFAAAAKADRASSDITRIRQIKKSMPADDWNDVAAEIVDRMGRASPGRQNAAGDAFSPSSFLTEWNKMDVEAKRLLLPESTRIELDKLAKVAERVKAAGLERNTSNTGTVVSGAAAGAGLIAEPITTSLALGSAYVSSKFLTSPMALRAMNKAARGDARSLEAMAKGKGPFAEDARTLIALTAAQEAGTPANIQTAPLREAR